MLSFKDYLTEGINDPAIFKAVFLAGGPGSGKSTTLQLSGLYTLGFRSINTDPMFEKLLDDAGLDKGSPADIASRKGQMLRMKAKVLTGKQLKMALDGRLGIIIDGTGADFEKIKNQSIKLKRIGYETAMVFVDTNLDTAQARNKSRPRSLDAGLVERNWTEVQRNRENFKTLFGKNFFTIENNRNDLALLAMNATPAYKKIKVWSEKPPYMPQAKAWMVAQREKVKR